MVIITSNNEKELPDAFLRRCVFHFIDFPETFDLMKQIVDVHHPNLEATLLDQVLVKFYWLRGQNELRKKPSTSELIDWISALLRSGMTRRRSSSTSRSWAPCSRTSRTPRRSTAYNERGGTLPSQWSELGPVQPVAPHGCGEAEESVFLDLFYALARSWGLPVAIQEWMMLMTRLEMGQHGVEPAGFYNVSRATVWSRARPTSTPSTASSRASSKGVEGELSTSRPTSCSSGSTNPKNFEELTDEQREALEQLTSDELMRQLPRDDSSRADRAPRRRRQAGSAPAGARPSAMAASTRRASGSAARANGRSAMKVAEERRFQPTTAPTSTLDCARRRWR